MIFAVFPLGIQAASSVLTPEQTAKTTLNRVEQRDGGLQLHHPRHRVDFAAEGVRFRPAGADHDWHWQLSHVGAGDSALPGVSLDPVSPILSGHSWVDYPRGAVTERYVFREHGIEQQFLIPRPLPLDGADLVIDGRVDSSARLQRLEEGWAWRRGLFQVTLGDVTVLDARGRRLPATMDVVADATHIRVDGAALASAEYPVLVDPVIGGEEIRITDETDFGPGSLYPGYARPSVAYNDLNDQYITCWSGVVPEGGITNPRLLVDQVVCKLLDSDGLPLSNDVVVSDMNATRGRFPVVAYGNTADGVRYLVAWEGTAEEGEPRQVFFSLLDSSLASIRLNRVLNSALPDATREARFPAVTYDEANSEFIAVYQSDYNARTGALANNDFEIFAARVLSGGAVQTRRQVSEMSGFAQAPAVAFGSFNEESLVVWHGVDAVTGTVPQVWGRFISNSRPQGTQFPISNMTLDAYSASLDYDSFNDAFLVAWTGLEDTNIDYEIYAQGVSAADGSLRLANDLQLSDMGPVGDPGYEGWFPAVSFDPDANQVLVSWAGDDDGAWISDPTKILGKSEVWGRTLNGFLGYLPVGEQFQVSYLGDPQSDRDDAGWPDIAYNSNLQQSLIVWVGRIRDPNSWNDFDIYARGFVADPQPVPSFDVDGNGTYSNNDAAILFNYISGNDFSGLVVPGGRTLEELTTYLDALNNSLGWDVNADGAVEGYDLFTLLFNYLLDGKRSNPDVAGLDASLPPSDRNTTEILLHLDCLGNNTPGLTPSANPVSPGDCPVPPLP